MNSITATEIKHIRTSIGWSAVEMGDFFNRTAATIYNWENGDSTPGATTTALMKTLRSELDRRRACHGASEVTKWIDQLCEQGLDGFLADLSVRPGFTQEAYRKLAQTAEEEGGLMLSTASNQPIAYVIPLTERGLMNYSRCLISPSIENGDIPDLLSSFAAELRESSDNNITITATPSE